MVRKLTVLLAEQNKDVVIVLQRVYVPEQCSSCCYA